MLSFAAVPFILAKGGAAYQDYGMGRSRGTLPFQLAGNIKQGGLVEKAFGVTLRELVEDFGGGTFTGRPDPRRAGRRPARRLSSGRAARPADGLRGLRRRRAPWSAMAASWSSTTRVDMAAQARFAMEFCAIESCGKCTPCRIGSTRGVEVIDKIIAGVDRDANLELLDDLCQTMTDGSLCAMGGLTPMPVHERREAFPRRFRQARTACAAE